MAGICSLFQLFPEIICCYFFIISHWKDLEFSKSSIWKRKKWNNKDFGAERIWTGDHLLKNLWSIHLGYLRVDECRWKKIDEIISVTANDNLYQHCACKPSLRTDTKLSFRAFRAEREWRANLPGIRLLFPPASKIPAWLFSSPSWPQLRLGQYVGLENNRRYILGLEK